MYFGGRTHHDETVVCLCVAVETEPHLFFVVALSLTHPAAIVMVVVICCHRRLTMMGVLLLLSSSILTLQ
jgi:hypothetical protein